MPGVSYHLDADFLLSPVLATHPLTSRSTLYTSRHCLIPPFSQPSPQARWPEPICTGTSASASSLVTLTCPCCVAAFCLAPTPRGAFSTPHTASKWIRHASHCSTRGRITSPPIFHSYVRFSMQCPAWINLVSPQTEPSGPRPQENETRRTQQTAAGGVDPKLNSPDGRQDFIGGWIRSIPGSAYPPAGHDARVIKPTRAPSCDMSAILPVHNARRFLPSFRQHYFKPLMPPFSRFPRNDYVSIFASHPFCADEQMLVLLHLRIACPRCEPTSRVSYVSRSSHRYSLMSLQVSS